MAKHRILILFAHPALQRSRVNRALIQEARGLDGVTIHDLYEAYPDFHIDVSYEQELLLNHDIIILQHPFYWYSAPAIIKEWFDLVLEHGWAYGREGKALHGKWILNVISTGGGESAYQPEGFNQHTILEFLAPVKQSALLCGMTWLPPYVVHGTHTLNADQIQMNAAEYRKTLIALRDGQIHPEDVSDLSRLNLESKSSDGEK
jgi:glutathione-regulated potassium-efflux system ancillary protein KefG